MKLLSLFTLLYILTTSLLAETSIDPYKNIKYFELGNGLKVYTLSDVKAVNTQIELKVDVGYSVETEDNAGITHLLEHLVFRDQRVPYNDYLDYLQEEGATFVNGYTSEYSTEYLATISSDKSYFLAKVFAQMVFDKNVTSEDLEIEKRALQVEVGELKWYHRIGYYISKLFKSLVSIFPSKIDIYTDSFELEKDKENIEDYIAKRNNTKFSLEEVIKHYDTYYYPQNMTLKIVGNFDEVRMQKLIEKEYGFISKCGEKHSQELAYNAKLKEKKFKYFSSAQSDKNIAYLGARYILDDYKQYLTLLAYSDYLSSKMQKLLRNKLGQTYSVSSYNSSKRNAGIIGVVFESLHDDFNENLALIQKQVLADVAKMEKKEIEEAISQAGLYYSSLEHDSETLMDLIGTQEYIHKYQNIYDKTPYEIFDSITPEYFQSEVSKSFEDKYRYLCIHRDYYLFPFDMLILSFIMFWGIIIYFRKASKLKMIRHQVVYTHRDVLLSRRIMSYFVSIVVFIIIFALTIYIDAWVIHFLATSLFGDANYMHTLMQPMDYVYEIVDYILFFSIYVVLSITVFKKFFTKMDLTDTRLYVVGLSLLAIDKSEITEIKKVSWSIAKFPNICGASILFFKPLVMIKYAKDEIIYLRAKNAHELEEDLNKWLEK